MESNETPFGDGLGRVEPEVVILGNQTAEEVKKLLDKEKTCEEDRVKGSRKFDFKHDAAKTAAKAATDVKECKEYISKAAKAKLVFEDAPPVDECFPDLGKINHGVKIKKDLNLFHTWRRLADVGEVCEDGGPCLPDDLGPTQELMDHIIVRLRSNFPKLVLDWSEGWNPCLLINSYPTQVSMDKLSFAHNGLKHIVDAANAQQIISNIVLKKLEELFI
jgi:hypothetical protein